MAAAGGGGRGRRLVMAPRAVSVSTRPALRATKAGEEETASFLLRRQRGRAGTGMPLQRKRCKKMQRQEGSEQNPRQREEAGSDKTGVATRSYLPCRGAAPRGTTR